MKKFKRIAVVLLFILLWTCIIGYGFISTWLLKPITAEHTTEAFVEATKQKIEVEFVGNMAMALIENGEVSKSFFYSIDQAVDEHTVFQVASISKWVTAFGIMKLVEEGKLNLDTPINEYLSRWQLPQSKFDNKKVSIRRLLSHSAGLVDDLGYAGYTSDQAVQTIEESLKKASDGLYSEGVAQVGIEPGSQYIYSGAGYTILQLIIEEVTGVSFQEYMTRAVFDPLQMKHSTFVLAEKPELRLAQLFKDDGTIAKPLKFTALAAASLYTCTSDLSKFLLAHVSSNTNLSKASISKMSTAESFRNDFPMYGLGPYLFSQKDTLSKVIGHDGSGSYVNTTARIDLISRDGIIILERGHHNLASHLADEWLYWKTGVADYVVMQRNKPYILNLLFIGYLIIIGISVFVIINSN